MSETANHLQKIKLVVTFIKIKWMRFITQAENQLYTSLIVNSSMNVYDSSNTYTDWTK